MKYFYNKIVYTWKLEKFKGSVISSQTVQIIPPKLNSTHTVAPLQFEQTHF